VVVVNTADMPNGIRIQVPRLAGYSVEQVSWPGNEWTTTFDPIALQTETLEIEMQAREGVVLEARPNLSGFD
jgi:hypothetical protein